jgi:DNA-binding transcriptional LysR family regulator
MDRLKQIETLVAVAARGSLTAAARAEGVAPAVIGRRIDALEERLGVKLLLRTTRRISLTHEGSAFLEDCQRLLADLANAEASVSAGGVKASGHLRITAPAGFGRRHVAPLVPRFLAQHPDVSVSLNLSDRVVDIVNEGFDCAIRVGDLGDSSLVSVRLADNWRLCVAAPAYLQRAGVPKTPAELSRHECLALSSEASQTRGWAFMIDGARSPTCDRAGGWTAATARCCTTGAWPAWGWPGAAPGRWSARSPPAACRWCCMILRRRPAASSPSSRSASTCRCACGCGSTSSSTAMATRPTGQRPETMRGRRSALDHGWSRDGFTSWPRPRTSS